MREYVLISLLVAMFFPAMVFGGEHGEARERQEDVERQIHLRRMQLEMEEQEAELDFNRRMRELDLKERGLVLEHKYKALKLKQPKHVKRNSGEKMAPLVIVFLVVHILLAVWVFQDIRRRSCGSGIWIVIVLLAGILGVLPYTIVRLGDRSETK